MMSRTWLKAAFLGVAAAATIWAGTFGKVVAIGGHASDLALDEARGVLYVANFTANRVDVVSLADNTLRTSINVASQPSSLALSPDGRFLVIAHYGNFAAPLSPANALTVITLDSSARQTFALGAAPLGVVFGIDGQALIATATEFLLFDPESASSTVLDTFAALNMKTLPQPSPSLPPQITAASMAASRDGLWIFGLTDTLMFGYDVRNRRIHVNTYISTPPQGPRVVSVADDGSTFSAGWSLNEGRAGFGGIFSLISQWPNPTGDLHVGSHVIDSSRGFVYVQIPEGRPAGAASGTATTAPAASGPVLQIADAENLAVYERLQLAENLSGKSILSSDHNMMYAISESGVTIVPVGDIQNVRRIQVSHEDVVFRGNFCDRRVSSQEILITDPSGNNTDFSIVSSNPAVRVTPSTGTTPARVRVSVDPNAFGSVKGTSAITLTVRSARAANADRSVRVLVNTREPDQRGAFYNVPGKIVDIVSDPLRDRFFLLRQDRNQVLVYDGATFTQVATLKTGNTPTQMAVSFDRRYLMIGSNNSQILYVYDLETLEPARHVRMPGGHYPKSVAASGKAILVANRVAGPKHKIDRVDLATGTAVELPTLGIFNNDIDVNTVLVASPNGSTILVAQENGTVMLYNANADTFTVARKDAGATGNDKLAGAYAASSYDQFVVGNKLLNASLVPMAQLETGTGQSSGFTFLDQTGYRITAPSSSAAGVIQKINLQSGEGVRPTRTVEAPALSDPTTYTVFTRTLAPLASRSAMVALTTSGFTVLPWEYDAAVAPPRIERVVNAADFTQPVAPGSLVSVFGSNLSPVSQTSQQTPLPTVLGESCLTVNGVPVPMIFVSGSQINAQLPYPVDGSTTMVLRTPGGVSDNFNLTISAAAPSLFRTRVPGTTADVATVIRSSNNQVVTYSNPVHRGDTLTIYATGLGRTAPSVEAGNPAPADPPAAAVIIPVVTLGGVPVEVTFAGLTPGQVGVYQINVVVNDRVPTGWNIPLEISQGLGMASVDVRVVN